MPQREVESTGQSADQSKGLKAWLYKRLPVKEFIETQATGYYAPKNFNIWYFFGFIAMVVLVMQLLTGIFLTMFYKPGEATSFDSVEFIMREVDYGWLIRYLHSTGASAFFLVVYLHMYRAIMYGSYRAPRELLWLFGMLVYLALMAEAFMGYVLPWGNMSYWAANVIVNIFGTVPVIGPTLVEWIRGDYGIADSTLNRFFALHVVAVPLALLLLVVLHLVALRRTGSNNPDGIEIKAKLGPDGHPVDGIPFHPYYSVKDSFGISVFLVIFATRGVLCPDPRRLFPGARELRAGGHLLDAQSHHALVVLHALLRHPACHPGPAPGRAADGTVAGVLPAAALAGSLAREIDPLQGGMVQGVPGVVHRVIPGAHVSGPAGAGGDLHHPGTARHRGILCLFHPDAVLHQVRTGQAGARSREVPGPCLR